MQRYILGRVFQSVLCLFGLSIVAFMLVRMTGDPLSVMMPPEATPEQWDYVRVHLGLNLPLYKQYLIFMTGVLTGNFGTSVRWGGAGVASLIGQRLPYSLGLVGSAMVVATTVGLVTGSLSARAPGGKWDVFGKGFALLGQSAADFWVAIILVWLLGVQFGLLPVAGAGGLAHWVLPVFCLGWFSMAGTTRLVRSTMLDILDSNYVTMLRLKGMNEWTVTVKHALRNALIPVLTLSVIQFGRLLSGAVVIETVFAWPGMARLTVDAVFARDYQVVQAAILVFGSIMIFSNLATDIAYAYLDPRVRQGIR